MKIVTQIHTQPLSETVGQQVINADNVSIFDLNQESIVNLFQSDGLY
ncbi:MAG: hypothetical protein QNJ41_05865 [Xenococcaceae cyanobacterium MO_188.B32]|nr:hypothetical protein [Xenococcaceae cyanobacterium MO_188.B32]